MEFLWKNLCKELEWCFLHFSGWLAYKGIKGQQIDSNPVVTEKTKPVNGKRNNQLIVLPLSTKEYAMHSRGDQVEYRFRASRNRRYVCATSGCECFNKLRRSATGYIVDRYQHNHEEASTGERKFLPISVRNRL